MDDSFSIQNIHLRKVSKMSPLNLSDGSVYAHTSFCPPNLTSMTYIMANVSQPTSNIAVYGGTFYLQVRNVLLDLPFLILSPEEPKYVAHVPFVRRLSQASSEIRKSHSARMAASWSD